jgi:hypothetical protein
MLTNDPKKLRANLEAGKAHALTGKKMQAVRHFEIVLELELQHAEGMSRLEAVKLFRTK